MERREQYDPEDLEHLLLERSFDELLEEERAYALRHLSGKAEYESMRTLLLSMAGPDLRPPVHEADPAVRDRLLHTFREHQRQRPSIWLNSVKAWLWPEHASAFWKPALAFGSLAVVVTLAVRFNGEAQRHDQLAELEQPQPPPPPALPQKSFDSAVAATEEKSNAVRSEQEILSPATTSTESSAPAIGEAHHAEPSATGAVLDMDVAFFESERKELAEAAPAEDLAFQKNVADNTPTALSHVVKADELVRNMSAADLAPVESVKKLESAASRAKFKATKDAASNGPAEVAPELLALLRAAW